MHSSWGSMNRVLSFAKISTLSLAISLTVSGLTLSDAVFAAKNTAAGTEEVYYSASFDNVEIREFIHAVGTNLQKIMIIDPAVRSQVTVRTWHGLTAEEYYQLFLSVLSINGYTAVEGSNGVIKVIPDKDARTSAIPVVEGNQINNKALGDEMATWVLPVAHVPVRELSPILRQLVDSTGSVVHYDPSNILIVSGQANNLERIAEIVRRVDHAGSRKIEIIDLQNAAAADIEQLLKAMYNSSGNKNSSLAPLIVGYESSNQVVISADPQNMRSMKALVERMDADRQSNGNVRVVYLHYAEAADVKKILDGMAKTLKGSGKGSSVNDFSIEVHEQTNALIVNARPDMMKSVENIVKQLDIRRAQVLVEAIIVEVAEGDGINLSLQLANNNTASMMQFQDGSSVPIGQLMMGLEEAKGEPGSTVTTIDPTTGLRTEVTNPSTDGDYSALASVLSQLSGAAFTITSGDWSALLQAVTTASETNVLATPSLMTLDNEEASFIVGDEVPTLTGSTPSSDNSNPYQTIERKEVGIKLSVTPQINAGDSVKLDIEQEVSQVNGQTPIDVTFSTRKVKTSVIARSGDTIVIGGLIDENVQESVSKVPILGDIPLIGYLFRSTSSKKSKKNLMVFLRPTIIRDDETLSSVSHEKYTKMRDYQIKRHEDGINLMPDQSIPVLPEKSTANQLLEHVKQRMAEDEKAKQGSLQQDKAPPKVKPARTYRTFGSKSADGA